MSIGTDLLASAVASSIEDYFQLNLSSHLFKGDTEVSAFEFVAKYALKYGALPTASILEQNQITLPVVDGKAEYFLDRAKERHRFAETKQTLLSCQDMLNAGNTDGAVTHLMNRALELMIQTHPHQIVDFAKSGHSIVRTEYLKKLKLGDELAFRFGWPTLDAMTGGLAGGDVVTIVGRPGQGKTYCMQYGAKAVWESGKTPLFISMEMKALPIIQRLAALVACQPVNDLKDAMLPKKQLKQLFSILEANKKKHPYWIVDNNMTATPQDILMLCRQLKPSIVYIDAAYLLKGNSKLMKYDRVADNIEFIKSDLAEALNIPVVISMQLNREAEKKLQKKITPGLGDIAYSDTIGQISSVVLGLFDDDFGVENLKERGVTILKGRNGEIGQFKINWNFTEGPNFMDFSEVVVGSLEELNFLG